MLLIDTDAWAESDRIERWREEFARQITATDWRESHDQAQRFRVTMRLRQGQSLALLRAGMTAVRTWRDRRLVADGADDATVMICQSGAVRFRHNEHVGVLRRGDMALFTHNRTIDMAWDCANVVTLQVPRPSLAGLLAAGPDQESLAGRISRRGAAPARLLAAYAGAAMNTGLTPLAERHLAELAADALIMANGPPTPTRLAARQAARLERLHIALAGMARAGDVTADNIGKILGVSGRTVQRDLAAAGTSLADAVLTVRLAQVADALGTTSVSITALAFQAGFNDLSHFNRAFRARYDMTPTDWRASNRRHGSDGLH